MDLNGPKKSLTPQPLSKREGLGVRLHYNFLITLSICSPSPMVYPCEI
mgnify:CR=1 FL=1